MALDLRQLKYFSVVAAEGHVGRAAERLHISQPPLTRQIQGLERELGVPLFRRTPRGMELTQAGQQLQTDAESIQRLVKLATDRAQRAGAGLSGRLDVGLYGSSILDVVPRILSEFRQGHPHVKVGLHVAQAPQQVIALRQGRVALVFERLLPDEPDLEIELVAREPLIVALHVENPLAQRPHIRVEDLRTEPLIMQSGLSSVLTQRILELCRAHGFAPKLVHEDVNDVLSATALVAGGYGTCLVPSSLRNLQMPGVVYRPLQAKRLAHVDLMCFYQRNDPSPILAELLKVIRRYRDGHSKP